MLSKASVALAPPPRGLNDVTPSSFTSPWREPSRSNQLYRICHLRISRRLPDICLDVSESRSRKVTLYRNMWDHVVEQWILDDVQWGDAFAAQVPAELEGGDRRGWFRLRRRIHAATGVPGPIFITASCQTRGHRRQTGAPVQAAATIAESHSEPVDAPVPTWRQGGTGDRHSGRLSRWVFLDRDLNRSLGTIIASTTLQSVRSLTLLFFAEDFSRFYLWF